MIWGIAGAFLGVAMAITILTICRATPALRWIADLFMDDGDQPQGALADRPDQVARDD
jgi:predicted PurR-regulated permease PerM